MALNYDTSYLGKLQDHYRRHHALPSMQKMAELLGMASASSAFGVVQRLTAAGYVTQGEDRRVAPTKLFFARPLVGQVRAGAPEPSIEVAAGGVVIDDELVQTPTRTVLLRVRGDSMRDAGIRDGDTVVVEKGSPAKEGDIVVALVDGEHTVKHLAAENGAFYLRAANPAFPDIRPRERLELYGLVVGMFRSYGR